MSGNPSLDFACPRCRALPGERCTKRGRALTTATHPSRLELAIRRAQDDATAEAIASWLEREYVTIGSDVAEAIRAGRWRKP